MLLDIHADTAAEGAEDDAENEHEDDNEGRYHDDRCDDGKSEDREHHHGGGRGGNRCRFRRCRRRSTRFLACRCQSSCEYHC